MLITHSIPEFPKISGDTISPVIADSQEVYGQNLFCVSLPQSKLFKIAGMMTLNKPYVYESRVMYPNSNITYLINKEKPYYPLETISYHFVENSKEFTYFAKNAAFNKNIWQSLIAPELKDGLWVESWGRPYSDPFCAPTYAYEVLNIKNITFEGYFWKGTQDHSKWALTITKDVVCYGDLNMMDSQDDRGGGAICLSDSQLYKFSHDLITGVENCS